jgi:RNA polymerase sigma-70 factor (ECF subfamily)
VERHALVRYGFSTRELADDEITEIEHAAELDELRATLALALRTLTADQRCAVQLRVVEELSYPEVARRIGITEATARARVSRGLRALTSALESAPPTERSTP